MKRKLKLTLVLILTFGLLNSCSQGDDISQEDAAKAAQEITGIIARDERLTDNLTLELDVYKELAATISTVKNVESAVFANDTLGTIQIKISGGGYLFWRHIKNTLTEAAALPAGLDFSSLVDPTWNSGWSAPAVPNEFEQTESVTGRSDSLQGDESNGHATHFPLALDNPDPEYLADDSVQCLQEGKIAIVDFQWSDAWKDAPGLYEAQFQVDGMMLYDRIKAMAEAAGFTLDLYKDTEINTTNFDKLSQYSIVYIIGHGSRPAPNPSK
ncbi:MAG: hypothetical protein WCQ99_15470, partial [Pseudomonadota bacterium]